MPEHDIVELDRVDRLLLEALQQDARLTITELAERVALTQSPCWRRVHRLEQSGLIRGYHARLDPHKLGFGVHGFVQMHLDNHGPQVALAVERALLELPEVVAAHNLSGHYDYQVEVLARDMDEFAQLLRERICVIPGVKEVHSSFVLRELKSGTEISLR